MPNEEGKSRQQGQIRQRIVIRIVILKSTGQEYAAALGSTKRNQTEGHPLMFLQSILCMSDNNNKNS